MVYRFSIRSSNIGGFIPFVAQNNIEFNHLAVTNRSYSFFRIVLNNSCLMHEYIFLGIVPVYKTVPAFDIEPFNSAGDFFGYF